MFEILREKLQGYELNEPELEILQKELTNLLNMVEEQLFAERLNKEMTEEMNQELWEGMEEY